MGIPSKAFTSAGTILSVSAAAPATYDKAGFTALTFTDVAEVTDLGEFGKQFTLVTHNPLATRGTVKRKGSFNNGSIKLQMARVPSDAGQALLIAGRDSDDSYSFKVVLQDKTIAYFSGQIMEYLTSVGTVNQITAASVTVEVDNEVIEVAPTP